MENSEMLALIKQMNDKLTRIENRQRRIRRRNLILLGCVAALIAALVIVTAPRVRAAVEQYNSIAAEIEKVAEIVDGINIDKAKEAVASIGEIDLSALKTKSEKLMTIVDSLSKLKVDSLNTVVEGLNSVMDKLTRFFK